MRICAQTTVPLEFYILQHFTTYLHHSTDIVRVLSHHKGTGGRAATPQPSGLDWLSFKAVIYMLALVGTVHTYLILHHTFSTQVVQT